MIEIARTKKRKTDIDNDKKAILPLSKIHKILREDEDLKKCSLESASLVQDGVQAILEKLIARSLEKCKEKKRKTLYIKDLKETVMENFEFSFLECLFEDEAKQ